MPLIVAIHDAFNYEWSDQPCSYRATARSVRCPVMGTFAIADAPHRGSTLLLGTTVLARILGSWLR
jgi:hypothetical protein